MTTADMPARVEPVAAAASPKLDGACFRKRADAVSMTVVALHLVLALAPVYLAAALGPGWYMIPLLVWVGLVMNGVLNLMHEASHFSVFRRRGASDFLGNWLLGPLVLADFEAYRNRHWDHHRHLGTERDTKNAYLVDIRGWRLLWLLVSCLLLIEAVKKFIHGLRGANAKTGVFRRWVLRAIAEHQVDDQAPVVTGRAALRNFRDNPISRLLLGAYGFSEHASHHLHPQVPSYRLTAATRDLTDRGRDDLSLGPGYIPTLFRLFRRGR